MSITQPAAAYKVNDSPTVKGGIWIVPDFTCELPFGTGYFQRSVNDCLRAALATAAQVAIEQVPDLRLDDRMQSGRGPDEISRTSWGRIEDRAEARNLTLRFWDEIPVPRERWIAVFDDGCTVTFCEM